MPRHQYLNINLSDLIDLVLDKRLSNTLISDRKKKIKYLCCYFLPSNFSEPSER